MSLRRVFVDKIDAYTVSVAGERAHHLARAARLRPGERVEVSDQKKLCTARVTVVEGELVEFEIETEIEPSPPEQVVSLFLSVIKFARFEWAIEKTTELGVHAGVPLVADRSDRRRVATAGKRVHRWRRIAEEAAQQARRMAPPRIEMPIDFTQALKQSTNATLFLLDRNGGPLHKALSQTRPNGPSQGLIFLVGPEGGWSNRELQIAQHHGLRTTRLGLNVLKTETAAVAALTASTITSYRE